jgi:hypothetical protein
MYAGRMSTRTCGQVSRSLFERGGFAELNSSSLTSASSGAASQGAKVHTRSSPPEDVSANAPANCRTAIGTMDSQLDLIFHAFQTQEAVILGRSVGS